MRARGFSLVELLAVMAIIAITSAISIPLGLNYVRNYQALAAAQNVAAQVQFARIQAIKRNSRNGHILSFDYPAARQFQFTTLDQNPATSLYDSTFPGPGLSTFFDPQNPAYGVAPAPPFNEASPGGGAPSPHGPVMTLPQGFRFDGAGGQFSSLLFRSGGSVDAVAASGVASSLIGMNGLDFQLTIVNDENGLSRSIRVSRNGRVTIQ